MNKDDSLFGEPRTIVEKLLKFITRRHREELQHSGMCFEDYVIVYTLTAGRSCNDIHVSLKCAVGDGGGVYVTPPKLLLLTNQTKLSWVRGS